MNSSPIGFLFIFCITAFDDKICSIQQVEEVYNFSQDDLLTEDVLILDTHAEVFVWVGQSVDPTEKRNALEIGQVLIKLCNILDHKLILF